MNKSTLEGFILGARITSLALVVVLPLWQFVITYSFITFMANDTQRAIDFVIMATIKRYPILFWAEVLSAPLVAYGFYELVHWAIA